MPLLGWLAGSSIVAWIRAWDHWVAFALLAFIGGKMVFEGVFRKEETEYRSDPTRGLTLVLLSIATSIDALAAGLGLGVLGVPILFPCLVIGIVTAFMSALGLLFGKQLGLRFGRGMTVLGGVVLIGIGVRILVVHLCS